VFSYRARHTRTHAPSRATPRSALRSSGNALSATSSWSLLYAVCCMLYAVCCMLNHRSHITYRRGAGGGDALPARGHVHGVGLGRLLPGPCLHFPLCPFPFRLSASPPSTSPPSAPASSGAPPLCPSYIDTCMHTHMHTLWRGKGYACV